MNKWRSGRVVYSSALEKHRSSKAGRRFESGLLRNLIVVERDTSNFGFCSALFRLFFRYIWAG